MTISTQTPDPHAVIDPAILYFGTPVVLVTSVNPDGSSNIMPMSSAFWIGRTGVLGIGDRSQTAANLQRNPDCVLNLPSADLVSAVDCLALTTGRHDVPAAKLKRGYRYQPDKFDHSGLTPLPSDAGEAARIAECPVNLEARVIDGLGDRVHPSRLATIDEDHYR